MAFKCSALMTAALFACVMSTVSAGQDTFAVDASGRAAAGITFVRTLSDAEIGELLQQRKVRPFAVYFTHPAGRHEVSSEQATLGLIAEGRRIVVQQADAWLCARMGRLHAMQQSRRNVRPAAGERFSFERLRLSEIEMTRADRDRIRRDEFAVHGLNVVGLAEDIRRLRSDPLIREFRVGERISHGTRREFVVTGMTVPRETPPRTTPEVDALTDEQVSARIEQLIRDRPAECREPARSTAMSDSTVRPQRVPGESNAFTAAGLIFRAESRLVVAQEGRPQPADTRMPQEVRIALIVSNPSDETIEVDIRGCTLMARVYRSSEPGGAPAWEEGRGGQCMDPGRRLTFPPRESRTFEKRMDVWRILTEALPPGRYTFAALFRLTDRTLEIPAGALELPDRLAGLRVDAETRLVGTELHATASVTNTTPRAIYLEYGDCALRLHAHRTPGRSDPPVWSSDARAPWDGVGGYACLAYLATGTIAPGATLQQREFQLRVPVREILADSLLDGRYYFSATLRLNFGRTAAVPAGSVTLALPREPLPSSRRAASVVYTASTDILDSASSPAIRTTVTALLPLHPVAVRRGEKNAALHRYSRSCPLVLYAYRDRARRDAAPRSGEPDWASTGDCGAELQEMALYGDEPRTFEIRTTSRQILDQRLPPGRYYLAVAVREQHRTIYLSAGEVTLAR
jgi:hypothetical protein